jgi:hypothetical protein
MNKSYIIRSFLRKSCPRNQPIRLPGLKPGVCSGLILSGASDPDLKIGVWRRRTYQEWDRLDGRRNHVPPSLFQIE